MQILRSILRNEEGEIRITKGRVKGIEGSPKTKSSIRDIPMLPQVKAALEELKKRPVQDKDGHVFMDKKGKPIDKHLDRIWARALKTAGIRHRESYQLRHTFATHCIIKSIPLPHIARHLGHVGIETLVRHYASWINDDIKRNNDKLREAFSSAVDTPSIEQTTDGPKTMTGA